MSNGYDERAARAWFREWADSAICYHPRHAATILRLLDRQCPRGEDVPENVLVAMHLAFNKQGETSLAMRAAINVLHDWRTAPPPVKKVQLWVVKNEKGAVHDIYRAPPTKVPDGYSIKRMVEAADADD